MIRRAFLGHAQRGALLALLCAGCVACGADLETSPPGTLDRPALGDSWLIINYWATWCAPCREEIPELNRLARKAPELAVYAVNFDGMQGDALTRAAVDMGIEFALLTSDPAPLFSEKSPTVLPTTLIVSPNGTVTTRLLGPQTEAGLREEIAYAQSQPQSGQ